MPPEFKTIEEAQAEIIRLGEELARVQTERDNYSSKLSDTEQELESTRKLNQQYFNKLSAHYFPEDSSDSDEDDTAPSCEDFAKTLTI